MQRLQRKDTFYSTLLSLNEWWWWGASTNDPSDCLLESWAKLFKLDSVDEGVDSRVGVAQPEDEDSPLLGKVHLNI